MTELWLLVSPNLGARSSHPNTNIGANRWRHLLMHHGVRTYNRGRLLGMVHAWELSMRRLGRSIERCIRWIWHKSTRCCLTWYVVVRRNLHSWNLSSCLNPDVRGLDLWKIHKLVNRKLPTRNAESPTLNTPKWKLSLKLLLSVVYCLGLNATSPSDLHLQGNRWGTS